MKTIVKGMLAALLVLSAFSIDASVALAYDANNPYTVIMNFVVPSDTSFTVTLAGSQIAINFNPATKNSTQVEPANQSASLSIPMLTITNTGNLNENYSINLTSAAPSWVTLKANSTNSYANASTYGSSTTVLTQSGWNNTAPSSNASVYLWADFSNAVGGTTSRTFQVNSKQS